MRQNAHQILRVVKETFNGQSFDRRAVKSNCSHEDSDGEIISCMWSQVTHTLDFNDQSNGVEVLRALTAVSRQEAMSNSYANDDKFLKYAQKIMSGTASNYNLARLYAGIGIAWLATMAALFISAKVVLDARSTGLWMSSIAISYGVMMFASSYVEEEQQFWYWATSSWLGWLVVKALVHDHLLRVHFQTDSRSLRGTQQRIIPSFSALAVLAIVRMVRGWNQTGQKHAGEPDIARTILPQHNQLLWFLVLGTYFNITQRLARKVLPRTSHHISAASSIALCVATLAFKIVFTKAEAPELLVGLQTDFVKPIAQASLVVQSRVIFMGIGTLVSLTILTKAFQASSAENGEGNCPHCRTTAKY